MAIEQDKVTHDLASLMKYDMTKHMFIPTSELIKEHAGIDFKLEANNENLGDIELEGISETVYGYMWWNMPNENKDLVMALLAENGNDEQNTLARAFVAVAPFILSGGDEISIKSSVNRLSAVFIPPEIFEQANVSLRIKQILWAGNGRSNTGLLFKGTFAFKVSDITDLEFGVDY